MKMSFVKRDKSRNATGVTIELDDTDDVAEIRKWYAANGWKEGKATKGLSDQEVAERAKRKRQK